MDTWEANVALRKVVDSATGQRHCRSCDKYKPLTGGKVRLGANGARIWRCATCTQKRNPAGFK